MYNLHVSPKLLKFCMSNNLLVGIEMARDQRSYKVVRDLGWRCE